MEHIVVYQMQWWTWEQQEVNRKYLPFLKKKELVKKRKVGVFQDMEGMERCAVNFSKDDSWKEKIVCVWKIKPKPNHIIYHTIL